MIDDARLCEDSPPVTLLEIAACLGGLVLLVAGAVAAVQRWFGVS